MKRKRLEEYLEAIYFLINKGERPGIRRLARELNVKPSTVLEYVRKLCSRGLIKYCDGRIELTDKGLKIVEEIVHRHRVIRELLIYLGVPEDIADIDACYIEHGVHDETIKKIEDFLMRVKKNQ